MEIQRLSANDRKYISGLSSARRRREECLFVAEGGKCVAELSPFFSCKWLVATDAWPGTACRDAGVEGKGR